MNSTHMMTTEGRKHLYLKPFVIDGFVDRVAEPKSRLITADGLISYLNRNFIKGFSPELIRDMLDEVDFKQNGFITDKDVIKAATGLYAKRRSHMAAWQSLLTVVTGESRLYLDPKTGYELETPDEHRAAFGHVRATGRDASFPRASTTALRASESLARSLRTSGANGQTMIRTSRGIRETTMTPHEASMQRHMTQTQQMRGYTTPFLGFDSKSEFLVMTGREKLRDQMSRSPRASAPSGGAGMTGSNLGGDFVRYFKPLGPSDLDNRRPLGARYDVRSLFEAERDAIRAEEAATAERFATMQL